MLSDRWSGDYGNISWASVSREKPCPICGKPDWCRTAKGGHLVTCHRSQAAPGLWRLLKPTASGGGVFTLDDGLGVRTFQPRTISTKPTTAKPADSRAAGRWEDQARAYQEVGGDRVQQLADQLGVDGAALHRLGCGWDAAKAFGMKGSCWTFPARDGDGGVIGIALRFPEQRRNRDGKESNKGMLTGGRQGLFYDPTSWSQGNGPILLVEGPSDTAAAMTMGLSVVGRPSNRGGVDHLVALLRNVPASRLILVVGERDEKADGNWPGRDGAADTAAQLAKKLHREIGWSIVPDGAKDTREFLQSVSQLLGEKTDPHRVGRSFADALVTDAVAVDGPPAPITEPQQLPTGPARDLESWRRDVAAARLEAAAKPGLYLDRSQTGAGKTFATNEAIRRANRCLVALPTHANVRERAAEMQAAGIDAVAFPELTPDNCQNYLEASRARDAGLAVGQSACIGCKFKKGCEYQADKAKADKAQVKVATHARLVKSPSVTKDCDLVVIDENPVPVLRPSLAASPAAIRTVENMAHRIMMRAANSGDRSGVMTFARLLVDTCGAIIGAMAVTEPGRYAVDLPLGGDVPDHWQAVLWRAMQLVDTADDPDSVALQLVTKAATGRLGRLEVVAERTAGGQLHHLAFGDWRTPTMPGFVSYQLLDATAEPDDVAAAAGHAVTDCTPEGFLPAQQQVTQIPLSITSRMSPAKVAAIIRAIMDRYPHFRRVGLIGHSAHIRAIMAEGSDLLDADARSRITKSCYFWEGPDRASNDWHRACDCVLVLGVPRPNPIAIRQQLLTLGQDDAATIQNPVWGDRHWQARTVDGGLVTVPGRGYHHPEWHRAHKAACRAQLIQCMGRARSILPEGVPCLVVADEPTGAAVDPRPLQLLPAAVQQLVAVIQRLAERQLSRIGPLNTEKLSSVPVATRDLLADPVFRQLTRQALTKRLDQARKLGVIHSPGRGLWAIADQADQPVTVVSPVEPITVAVAMAEPATAATIQATTADADPAATDDLREAIAERAAMLEFDGGLDREQADQLALAMVMGPPPTEPSGDVHQQVVAAAGPAQLAGPATARRHSSPSPNAPKPDTNARNPGRPVAPPSVHAEDHGQGGLWSPSHLRQLNPWG